jgi:predicted dithiol-disulfide oxidoreductase (DUF899 family)
MAHLHARDTTLALVSRAPLAQLEQYREYNYSDLAELGPTWQD